RRRRAPPRVPPGSGGAARRTPRTRRRSRDRTPASRSPRRWTLAFRVSGLVTEHIPVHAARIPDRDRLLEELHEAGLEARPIGEIEIEVSTDDLEPDER